ncbi:hypothetical protein [Bdellovibrio bacteriovorus]|uniref:hypothetical protein n=1 Tax=Bdellovibrio bacteriovorus TaxID=959 RepID=UPI003AA885E2
MTKKDAFLNLISNYIQPLGRARIVKNQGLRSSVDDLVPGGSAENFQHASHFGFISNPPKGVLAFFLNLIGRPQNPVIMSFLHKERIDPGGPGATALYSTDASGKSFPVKIFLEPGGIIRIEADSKFRVVCDNIELGADSLEKVLNGETFQRRFNEHVHVDSIGGTTLVPTVQSPPSDLSSVVKAKK